MKPIFRSAMFGFHKSDVFSFITKQNKQYESKIADLNAELEKAKEDFEKEREAFDRDITELDTLRITVEQMKSAVSSAATFVADIMSDKEKLLSCADQLKSERADWVQKINAMQEQVREAEKLRVKAEKFDQLSGVLSSIFNQSENLKNEESEPSEPVETYSFDSQTVSDLLDHLEVLSAHCEKLQIHLESGKKND